jgi:6-phosphogluconolactonase
MSIDIQVVDDPAQVCAEHLSAAAASGGNVVLTGGSTPTRAYELAAERHPKSWAGASVWLTDDRCVGPADENSNFKMIKESLLDTLEGAGVEVGFCRRILGERGPEEAALEYERELEHVGGGPGAIRFELILVGIGPDGHIFSMFPGQESLSQLGRLAVGVPVAGLEPFVPRVTMTFAAVTRAKRILVLAPGASKADPVARAFAEGAASDPNVPASMIKDHAEDIIVLLDQESAAKL